MPPALTQEEEEFLTNHRFATLATGRKDGSPQASLMGYYWDGAHILMSTRMHTAKWKNAVRLPNVALTIHDEFAQLTIYGTAECIDQDPLRAELTAETYNYYSKLPKSSLAGRTYEVDEDFIAELNEEGRGILRVTPNKILGVLLDY